MQSIKEIIPEVVKNLSERKSTQRNIGEVWSTVAGDEAHFTDIIQWRQGVLKIHVDSSARLYKFNLKKGKLVKEMKKEIAELEQIIFKVGRI